MAGQLSKLPRPLAVLAHQQANVQGYPIARSYGYNTDALNGRANPPVYTGQPRAQRQIVLAGLKRKLFPALYHLERRGELSVPVVGSGTELNFCRPKPSVESNTMLKSPFSS